MCDEITIGSKVVLAINDKPVPDSPEMTVIGIDEDDKCPYLCQWMEDNKIVQIRVVRLAIKAVDYL